MTDFSVLRHNMVESQLRTNEVAEPRLIDAIEQTPRELFVPERYKGVAYVDEDLEIAPGRYLMEPMVLARLLQAAALSPDDVVLDVGCGTGYGAALLGRLAGSVVALESDHALAQRADALLSELGVDNVAVIETELRRGYPKQAPYDVILFEGSIPEIEAAITDQLSEGGRLLAVRRPPGEVGRATLALRAHGGVSRRALFDAAVPPLPGFEPGRAFVF
ncbi:MAG: protein-L-isoaspartate O-methyltransferase [Alphaproteobacteria bacterium]|nr:protein-L-isoaspartate O-methyltransferase [Pseudomonadota bacterium]